MEDDDPRYNEGRDKKGRFIKGQKAWKNYSSHGRNPKFDDPDKLFDACCEYLEYAHENPLLEDQIFSTRNGIEHEPAEKMRATTIEGLCAYIRISKTTWAKYRENEALKDIVDLVENIMFDRSIGGAAAGLLNANIIARYLSLSDKQDLSHSGSIEAKTKLDLSGLTKDERDALRKIIERNSGKP